MCAGVQYYQMTFLVNRLPQPHFFFFYITFKETPDQYTIKHVATELLKIFLLLLYFKYLYCTVRSYPLHVTIINYQEEKEEEEGEKNLLISI